MNLEIRVTGSPALLASPRPLIRGQLVKEKKREHFSSRPVIGDRWSLERPEVQDVIEDRCQDAPLAARIGPELGLRGVGVAVAAFESFAKVILVLVAIHIALVAESSAAIVRLIAIVVATSISPVVGAGSIALLIAAVNGTPDQFDAALIGFVVVGTAMEPISMFAGLFDRLLLLFAGFLDRFLFLTNPVLFVCPPAVSLGAHFISSKKHCTGDERQQSNL